jgi:gamma-glutamyltranspeptidase/glutathione hydrolase
MAVPATASLPGIDAPRRGPVFGSRFAVAADHPLAALAALDVLRAGGNAADATVAASAVNVVVKPHRTHLGGDAFALVWRRASDRVEALNAGGRAPLAASLDRFSDGIPTRGPRASTVPGLVDAWLELRARRGSRPLDELLRPAIALARDGFPVSLRLAGAMELLRGRDGPLEEEARRLFLRAGRPYRPGETLRQPELAETLERIAADGRDGFYGGPTGRRLVMAMASEGGLIGQADLDRPAAHWQEPHRTAFARCQVVEQPLPSQGLILLVALNILESFPLADWGFASADAVHVMIEATRLAFAELRRHGGDPDFKDVPLETLLSREHARALAGAIDLKRARGAAPASAPSDTTSFVVADSQTVVSFIQSVFSPWGSGFAIPGTGVLMNNRLRGFSADPTSPNALQPGKRTLHTLNTFLVLRDGQLVIGGGTPGADFQVQTNLQTIVGALLWGFDLQTAIDAPRWAALEGNRLALEGRYPESLAFALRARGHDARFVAPWEATLARSQVIASLPDGGWAVASDLRGEGVALAV